MSSGINWDAILRDVDPNRNGNRPFDNRPREERISTGRENAMEGLDNQQVTALESLELVAQAKGSHRPSREVVLEQIRQFLVAEYERNPVIDRFGHKIGFENLQSLSRQDKERLYQNVYHTAYRYLFMHPNPLVNEAAPYTNNFYRRSNGSIYTLNRVERYRIDSPDLLVGRGADIADRDYQTIDVIWQALNDDSVPLAEGYDRTSVKEIFARTLADIGRGHNWDNSRQVMRNITNTQGQVIGQEPVTEEYDDLTGDNPSCDIGVQRRLVQFVMLAIQDSPDTRPLDTDIMSRRFVEQMIGANELGLPSTFNNIAAMNLEQARAAKTALDNLVLINLGDEEGLEPEDIQALRRLAWWSTEDLQRFINEAKQFYGISRIKDNLTVKPRLRGEKYDNFGMLIINLAKNALEMNYNQINAKLETKINELAEVERLRLERERIEREQRLERERLEREGQQRPTTSIPESTPRPILTGFGVHVDRDRFDMFEERIRRAFGSESAKGFLRLLAGNEKEFAILNEYQSEIAQKLALRMSPLFLERIRQLSSQQRRDFLLQFAFTNGQRILLSPAKDLFEALVMSNAESMYKFNELSFAQIRALDAKLTTDMVERYSKFKVQQQVEFFDKFVEALSRQRPNQRISVH